VISQDTYPSSEVNILDEFTPRAAEPQRRPIVETVVDVALRYGTPIPVSAEAMEIEESNRAQKRKNRPAELDTQGDSEEEIMRLP